MKRLVLLFIPLCIAGITLVGCAENKSSLNANTDNQQIEEVDRKKIVLAENSKEKIVITGEEQEDSGMVGPITIQIDEKSKTFEWLNVSNPSYYPELEVADLNGDQQNEIYIFLNLGYGTGFREMEAHILQKDFSEISPPKPEEDIEGSFTSSVKVNGDEREYTITLDGQSQQFSFNNSDAGIWFEKVVVGNMIRYRIEENSLIASISVQVSPGSAIGQFEVAYTLEDQGFAMKSKRFVTYD